VRNGGERSSDSEQRGPRDQIRQRLGSQSLSLERSVSVAIGKPNLFVDEEVVFRRGAIWGAMKSFPQANPFTDRKKCNLTG
jgi:hypothetical protein